MFASDLVERVAAQWGKGPDVFRDALSDVMFTEREFMAGLVATADEYLLHRAFRVSPTTRPGRAFLGTVPVEPPQLRAIAPRDGSETCPEYVQRMRRTHPNEDFSIVLDDCETHLPIVRERLTPFLHGLFARVGYPARGNHACVYAGTYRKTAFGIHRDDCHVLMFCGIGRKQMAFWPRGYFESRPDLMVGGALQAPVRDHIAHATVLDIGPQDVLYWPAADWHVGVSETDEFHAALSMGIYHHGSNAERFLALECLPTSKTRAAARHEAMDVHGLPLRSNGTLRAEDLATTGLSGFFEQWRRVRDELNKPGEAEYRALEFVLTAMSSAGFGRRRISHGLPLQIEGRHLRCPTPEALIVAPVRGGLLVGANGSSFFYGSHRGVVERVIADLRVRSGRVDDILTAVEVSARDAIREVLRNLTAAGAVTLEG